MQKYYMISAKERRKYNFKHFHYRYCHRWLFENGITESFQFT